jgi:glycosyltransferase involved in cell wall biosynthesis
MPSLWLEGFGLIAMEAMLRGLPVIASNSGGLQEAKAGTGFIIPVKPIERFEAVFDETHMPKPVDVPQDIEPWAEALLALLTHRAAYDQESARSRAVALKFVSSLRVETFEEYLLQLHPREPVVAPAGAKTPDLTPAQRALLLKRLRDRK